MINEQALFATMLVGDLYTKATVSVYVIYQIAFPIFVMAYLAPSEQPMGLSLLDV